MRGGEGGCDGGGAVDYNVHSLPTRVLGDHTREECVLQAYKRCRGSVVGGVDVPSVYINVISHG